MKHIVTLIFLFNIIFSQAMVEDLTNYGWGVPDKTYIQLLHVPEGIQDTLNQVFDGDGTGSVLWISNDSLFVNGVLIVGDNLAVSGIIAISDSAFIDNLETNVQYAGKITATGTIKADSLKITGNVNIDGNLGIGTSPYNKLTIDGDIAFMPRKQQALVTFTFDGAYKSVQDVFYPLFNAKGIVGCLAPTTSLVGGGADSLTHMDIADLTILYDAGWEMMSHSEKHPDMRTITEDSMRVELGGSLDTLRAWGFDVNSFVYPGGTSNDAVKRVTREYYRSSRGVAQSGVANPQILDTYDLAARFLYNYNNLEDWKVYVDNAESQKKWLIFYHHWVDTEDSVAIATLIDYIQAKNIDIVTIEQGLDLVGNILDIGENFAVGEKGVRLGGNVGINEPNPDSTLEVNGSVHITDNLRVEDNVGIGTNTPQSVLDLGIGSRGRSLIWGGASGVDNWIATLGTMYGDADFFIGSGLKLSTANSNILYSYTGTRGSAGMKLKYSNGDIAFANEVGGARTADETFDFVANTKMIIKESGNIGIGLANPSSKLSIGGGLHVGGSSDAGDNNLIVDGTITVGGNISVGGTVDGIDIDGGNIIVEDATVEGHLINQGLQNSLVGNYYNFDGDGDYIATSDNDNLDFGTGDFSVVIRFKYKTTDANGWLYSKGGSGTLGHALFLSNGTILRHQIDDGGAGDLDVAYSTTFVDGEYYTIVTTFDRDGNAIGYVNGVLNVVTDIISVGDISNAVALTIGGYGTSNYVKSDISLVQFYNRALTADEVAEVSKWDSNNPPIWFSDVGATTSEQTSGTLTIGKRYRINDWISNDDFTDVAGETGEDGLEFIAIATTPNVWTNSSTVEPIGAVINYNEGGMSTAIWYDNSGNDLDGTVSGATLIRNEDTVFDNIFVDGDVVIKGTISFPSGYERHIDLQISAATLGPNAPTPTTIGTFRGLGFDADNESAYINIEIPSDWDGASDMVLHVHWYSTSGDIVAENETVKWDITYRSIAEGEAVDNGTAVTATTTFTGGASEIDKEHYHTLITIDYDNGNQPLTVGDDIGIQFDRDVTTDDYTGAGIVYRLDLVYTSNKLPEN